MTEEDKERGRQLKARAVREFETDKRYPHPDPTEPREYPLSTWRVWVPVVIAVNCSILAIGAMIAWVMRQYGH